jgi:hypothetical protein
VGDAPSHVERNLALAGAILGVEKERICYLSQVHGKKVVILTDPGVSREETTGREGDAVMSRHAHLACGVRTADCVPILLASPETGWVAAVHAGWRGAAQGIAREAVNELSRKGAGRVIAAIGPHISQEAFEVSSDVAEELRRASPDQDIVDSSGKRPHVDLRRMIRSQLEAAGLQPQDIDDVPGCTYLQPTRFFSFRREGRVSGRHLSAIVARAVG